MPLRTLAGFHCVKKALIDGSAEYGLGSFAESDFVLGHGDGGTPVVLRSPASVIERFRKICISVSHTADHAAGMAVFDCGDGHE